MGGVVIITPPISITLGGEWGRCGSDDLRRPDRGKSAAHFVASVDGGGIVVAPIPRITTGWLSAHSFWQNMSVLVGGDRFPDRAEGV